MKKLLFICLIGMLSALTIRAEITIRIDANSRGLEMTRDDTGFGHLRAEGFHLVTEAGAPELPFLQKTYYLPYNAAKAELIIREGERIPVFRDFTPFPSQGLIKVGAEEDETTFISLSDEYKTGIYPKESAQIISRDIIMEQNLVTVALYPYLFDADEKTLYKRSLDVTITYETDPAKEEIKVIPSYIRRETARELVKSLVDNPQDVQLFKNEEGSSARKIQPLRTGGDGTSMPDYIIITCDSLVEAFQPLAEWKNRKGIPTIIETTEFIESHYEGADLCDKIRNYLKERERKWGLALNFLLGGDASIIPSYEYDGHESREVTDVYYVNRNYWPPTIEDPSTIGTHINSFIGRFPIKNATEVGVIINKVIRYEKANELIDYSYINNNIIADAYISYKENNNNSMHFYNGAMDSLYQKTHSINKNFWYLFDFFNQPSSYYSNGRHFILDNQPSTSITTGEHLTKNSFLNALRFGANGWGPFHIVYHGDHSERTVMGASVKKLGTYITSYDIDTVGFQDSYYQVIFSSGCHPADFRTTCIGKSFLCRQNSGAVAFVGNVDVGWSNEIAPQYIFNTELFLINNIYRHRIGNLWVKMLKKSSENACRLHLLGDPTLVVWTNIPQLISPTASLSGNSIQISRPSSCSGQTWHVCAYKKGDFYAIDSLTTGNSLSFPISDIRTSGYVYLTYTGLNLRPYCDSIYINKGESSQLEISVQSIGNNPYNASDIALSPGDSVPITVNIHNNGNTMVNRMTVQFASDNPNINIGEGQKYHFYLDAGESFQETFGFRVKTDCPTSTIHENNGIRLYFSITDDNNNHYYDECYINVYKPKPIITYLYYGGVQGLSNTYELKVKIANSGFLPLNGQQCILTSTHPNVTITQGTANIGTLLPGERSNLLTYRFTSSVFYSIESVASFLLNLNVRGTQGWTVIIPVEGSSRPASLFASDITIKPGANYIDISVSNDTTIKYDIYRKIDNEYVCISDYPVFQYFRDTSLAPQTTYNYKLKSITVQGVECDGFSEAVSATTLCAKADGFPKRLMGSKKYMGGLVAWDVDRDGQQEVFAKYMNWLEDKTSVVAIRANGEDLYTDFDNYITEDIDTKPFNSQNAPSIGELLDDGVMYVAASTYSDSLSSFTNNISLYSLERVTEEETPTIRWEKTGTNFNCPRSPVITDLDGDDICEVIIPAGSHIYIYNLKDSILADITKSIGHRTIAVASIIPNNTNKQIVFPSEGKMYMCDINDTEPFMLYQAAGKNLSSPVICDYDSDGVNEVIFGEWNTSENDSDSTNVTFHCLKYYSNTNIVSTTLFSNRCRIKERHDCNISIGDVNHDGKPDVVSYGVSKIVIYNNEAGAFLAQEPITTNRDHLNYAIIADVNGDNFAEVIYPIYKKKENERESEYPVTLKAIDHNGTVVNDFCIKINELVGEDIMIADIDGDGFSELIVGEECGQMSVWKTKGNPEIIEWGMVRGDAQNTGEYHKTIYPQLMQSGTITTTNWNKDLYVTGNGVNASGIMNVADHRKVIVWDNGVMNLSGATMNNAKVIVKDGGTMNVSNASTVNLRDTKSFQVDKGGTLSITSGTIK